MTEPGGPYTLTHQDLSRIVGVSVTTIKSYRRKFPEFFFPPSQTKPLRFRPETEKLCLKIAELFAKGWTIKRIRQDLTYKFPVTSDISKLPTSSTPAPQSGAAQEHLERVLFLLGQMNKGLGAMATAQARFGLESQKEKTRLDTLIDQQAALAERLDALARSLEQLVPALLTDNPQLPRNSIQAAQPSRQDLDEAALQSSQDPGGHTKHPILSQPVEPATDSSQEPHLPGTDGHPAPESAPSSPGTMAETISAAPTRRVIHVQGKTGTQAYEFAGAQPGPASTAETSPISTSRREEEGASSLEPQPSTPTAQPGASSSDTAEPPVQTQNFERKPDFLHLPVVLRSARGEYLGLTGKTGRPFSLAELEIYLSQRPDLKPMRESWKGQGSQWTLNLNSPDSATGWHAFHITRTQTPKGNQVALLSQLDLDGKTVTEAFLQAFFRQIREALITH